MSMEVYKIRNQPSVNTQDIKPGTLSLIDNFLNEKIFERKSPKTVNTYKKILYLIFSKIKKDVMEITSDDMLNWLESFKINKRIGTISLYLSVATCFFNYCHSEKIITQLSHTEISSRSLKNMGREVIN